MKFIASIFALLALAAPLAGSAADRVLLGERHVTDVSETDTIEVGSARGKFQGLQIEATGSAIEFKRVVIHFENGGEQVLEQNRVVRKGAHSRVVDLQGGPRFVERVVFHYEARSKGWGGAHLKLYGVRP